MESGTEAAKDKFDKFSILSVVNFGAKEYQNHNTIVQFLMFKYYNQIIESLLNYFSKDSQANKCRFSV